MKKRTRRDVALQNPSWYTPHPNSMLARVYREGGTAAAKVIKIRREVYEVETRRYENQLLSSTYGDRRASVQRPRSLRAVGK